MFKTAFFVAALGLVASAASAQLSKPMEQDTKYRAPITGTKLDEYTAHPKRLLVFETKQGTIKCQLFEKVAPKHVARFMELAKTGFWTGTTFHRVIPGFMIQGGDPNSKDNDYSNDGMGDPSIPTIQAEFSKIHHSRGILSTARRGNDVNSASSQIFIMHQDAGFLDQQYTVWGQVIEGMDVVDKIVSLPDVTGRTPDAIQQGGANPGKAAEIIKAYVVGE
jgi:peptidyl-prolyl cis-trans isomerase B (cyclophilin B)